MRRLLLFWRDSKMSRAAVLVAILFCLISLFSLGWPRLSPFYADTTDLTNPRSDTVPISSSNSRIVGWTGFQIADYSQFAMAQSAGNSFAISRVLTQAIPDMRMSPYRNPQASNFVASSYPYSLASNVKEPLGSIMDRGKVFAGGDTFLLLLGGAVTDSGALAVEVSRVSTASGDQITVVLTGNRLLSVVLDEATGNKVSSILNSTSTAGNKMRLASKTVSQVFDSALNQEGIVKAVSVKEINGMIELVSEVAVVNPKGMVVHAVSDRPIQGSVFAASSLGMTKQGKVHTSTMADLDQVKPSEVAAPRAEVMARAPEPAAPIKDTLAAASRGAIETLTVPESVIPFVPQTEDITGPDVMVSLATKVDADVGTVKEIKIIDREDKNVHVIYLTALNEMTTIESADNLATAGLSSVDRELATSVMRLLSSVRTYVDAQTDRPGPVRPSERAQFAVVNAVDTRMDTMAAGEKYLPEEKPAPSDVFHDRFPETSNSILDASSDGILGYSPAPEEVAIYSNDAWFLHSPSPISYHPPSSVKTLEFQDMPAWCILQYRASRED